MVVFILILLVGFIYERRHTREIAQLKGLQKVAPIMAGVFTLVMLSSIGLPGTMAVRLQPNHPTDSAAGIAASILDGLLYGAGDAVIGINPVSDNLPVLIDLLKLVDEVISQHLQPGVTGIWQPTDHWDNEYSWDRTWS